MENVYDETNFIHFLSENSPLNLFYKIFIKIFVKNKNKDITKFIINQPFIFYIDYKFQSR